MARAPFQVLVFPYRRVGRIYEFALFKRSDDGYWQGIAGGGEDEESPMQAAIRETFEETGISGDSIFMRLDTISSVPVTCFKDSHLWGEERYVILQYCFGVKANDEEIKLSAEHLEFGWFKISEAMEKVKYESNKTALWELNQKLKGLGPRD